MGPCRHTLSPLESRYGLPAGLQRYSRGYPESPKFLYAPPTRVIAVLTGYSWNLLMGYVRASRLNWPLFLDSLKAAIVKKSLPPAEAPKEPADSPYSETPSFSGNEKRKTLI